MPYLRKKKCDFTDGKRGVNRDRRRQEMIPDEGIERGRKDRRGREGVSQDGGEDTAAISVSKSLFIFPVRRPL